MSTLALAELDAATTATAAAIADPAADLVDIFLAAEAEEAAYSQIFTGPCDRVAPGVGSRRPRTRTGDRDMTTQPQNPVAAAEPLRVFDLFDPGKADPVTEAEVAAHHAAYPDPRSYDAKKAWREAHPDQPSPVHRLGSVLGALFRELEPDPDEPVPFTLTGQAEATLDAGLRNGPEWDVPLETGPEAEAEWADEWDSADSHAYMDRVEAGLEPEAEAGP